jgi:hypothetical protein
MTGMEDTGDLFHNQLMYALKGTPKCSTEVLCDPSTLDVAWVFLRNVGIFVEEDPSVFLGLRKQLYESYRSPFISEQKIRNLLYLLAYGEIAEIGANDLMDQDDFLHFLIAVYYSPVFEMELVPREKRQLIEKKLTQELVQYVQELLLESRSEYLCYLTLLPQGRLVEEGSSVIASLELLSVVDWEYLSRALPPNLYRELVQATLQKCLSLKENYLEVA